MVEEDKPKAITSKEWVKGYKKWKNEGVHGQQEQEELNASYKQSLANKKEREMKWKNENKKRKLKRN